MEARRRWHNIFQVLKEKNCQATILYAVEISSRNEGEIEIFSEEEKQREFVAARSTLKE